MTSDNADSLRWQGTDERAIVTDMLSNPQSVYWITYLNLVERFVQRRAHNISPDARSDIVQNVMERVRRNLPEFAYRSTLRTWITTIALHCTIDEVRRQQQNEKYIVRQKDAHITDENEEVYDLFISYRSKALEETFDEQELLRKVLDALVKHLATREHPERDGAVIDIVIFQDRSREDAAEAAGISVEMVGYIIRTAQSAVRQQVGYQLRKTPKDR